MKPAPTKGKHGAHPVQRAKRQGLRLCQEIAKGLWHFLLSQWSNLQKVQAHITVNPPKGEGLPCSTYLSYLPPLKHFLEAFPKERFENKTFVIFLGFNAKLNERDFEKANLPFEKMAFGKKHLLVLKSTPKVCETLAWISQDSTDWWLLVLDKGKPDQTLLSLLNELRIVTGPAAFRKKPRPAIFGRHFLMNYYIDPSFHSATDSDFDFLAQALFKHVFRNLYPNQLEEPDPSKQFDAVSMLKLNVKNKLTTRTHHEFIIRGGIAPCITKIDWPGGDRKMITWLEHRWSALIPVKRPPLTVFVEIISQYLIPVLLLPVAIIITPLTLLFWGIKGAVIWLYQRISRS